MPRRKKSIVRVTCCVCGLKLTGELRGDGYLYASRSPWRAVVSDAPHLCMACAIREGAIVEADQ